MKRKIVAMLCLALAVVFVFSACRRPDPVAARSGHIIAAHRGDIVSLDPHATNDALSGNANRQIYNALIRSTADLEFVGDLAESWVVLSPTEWQFNLRRGVRFHDGSRFTASDVRFSLLRQQTMPQVQHLVAFIADVRVIDDYTVIIDTRTPVGPMLANLSHSATRILSESAVNRFGDRYAENPIGTGPLKFVSWSPGNEVVLERFDDYFEGRPATERLTIRVIPEGTSRTIALETGEVDLILEVEPVDKARIEANSNLILNERLSNRIEWLAFNFNTPPFDNRLVRHAIAYAINQADVLTVALDGRGDIAHSFTGPTVFGYNPEARTRPYDPARARQLLAQAGFPNGFATTLWASGDIRARAAQVVQANLAEVGIRANIELLEWAAYLDRTGRGEHDLHVLGWANLTGDADPGMFPLYHTRSMGAGGNRSFYSNPRVDAILDQGRIETNMARRLELYHELHWILHEDLPIVPLFIQPVEIGHRVGLNGVEVHPGGLHLLHMLHY